MNTFIRLATDEQVKKQNEEQNETATATHKTYSTLSEKITLRVVDSRFQ